MLLVMNIGDRVRTERRKKMWSQNDLAKASGVTQGLISQIENGTNASSKHLVALARVLDVSPDWLETGKGEVKRKQAGVPLSLHYPPVINDTLAVMHDPEGSDLIFIVLSDVNGCQVTVKLEHTAARTLAHKLAALGR